MSTTGNLAPSCEGNDPYTCTLGLRGLLWGLFIVFGVPIYAVALGFLTIIFLNDAAELKERKLILKPITNAEYYFASSLEHFKMFHKSSGGVHIDRRTNKAIPTFLVDETTLKQEIFKFNDDNKSSIDYAGFVILQLIRLGKCYLRHLINYSKEMIERITTLLNAFV